MCSEGHKELMIIDTDCGIDDSLAFILALSFSLKWKILAITCGHGNTAVGNVCQNVLKVLNVKNETLIPVYQGCSKSLINDKPIQEIFGEDGFGNMARKLPTGNLKVEKEHAVNILVKLAREYHKEITLVALGPLTNIAMAQRLDSEFTSNLKSMIVMGGNYKGIGNVMNAAEFNFYTDPESAHIVFSEANCTLWLVPWEAVLDHGLPSKEYSKRIEQMDKKNEITSKITSHLMDFCTDQNVTLCDSDFLAMAVAVHPQSVSKLIIRSLSVELCGTLTRGQVVIERESDKEEFSKKETKRKVNIVTSFNDRVLDELRARVLDQ